MKVQSFSIDVPADCPNACEFCVSRMRKYEYKDRMSAYDEDAQNDFIKRMEYAQRMGADSVIFTGAGEPLDNRGYIELFYQLDKMASIHCLRREIQSSGAGLKEDYGAKFLKRMGIDTFSLSLSSLESGENKQYNRPCSERFAIDIGETCADILENNMNLRLSLNMTDHFHKMSPEKILQRCSEYGASQVTFRVLYAGDKDTTQKDWIIKHGCNKEHLDEIKKYVVKFGRKLHKLSFGSTVYAINDMSVVVDEDCMAGKISTVLKYLILRPDCHLYSHWDEKGSLIY